MEKKKRKRKRGGRGGKGKGAAKGGPKPPKVPRTGLLPTPKEPADLRHNLGE